MALFGKKDELFEIMARQRGGGNTPTRTPSVTSRVTRRPSTSGAWSYGSATPASSGPPELFEVDGDALVLVDDGFMEGVAAEDGADVEAKTFTVRSDTAVVGAILTGALLVASFLFGRHTAEPAGAEKTQGPGEVSVVVVPPPAPQPAAPAQPELDGATTVPAGATNVAGAVTGGFRPEPAAEPAPEPAPEEAPAAVAQVPADDAYMLVVCTTTPDNAANLAKWFNEDPRSPIFGREGIAAESTTRGEVRIRGFQEREDPVLQRVRLTSDPLGGGGTFHSAYYRKKR